MKSQALQINRKCFLFISQWLSQQSTIIECFASVSEATTIKVKHQWPQCSLTSHELYSVVNCDLNQSLTIAIFNC